MTMHRPLSDMPTVVVIRGACVALLVVTALVGTPAPAPGQDLAGLVRQVSPSVVVIRAKGREVTAAGQTRFTETGSGVLVSADGKVMTAAHVVHAMEDITVEFLGGDTVSARVVASEPGADLSLLQLDQVPAGVTVARLADSDAVQVGESIWSVGYPSVASSTDEVIGGWLSRDSDLEATVNPGTITAIKRNVANVPVFQTNVAIYHGNSGGPAVDKDGARIRDGASALACYRIKDASGQTKFASRDVAVDDEFGGRTDRLLKPSTLCVPSSVAQP